MGSPPNLCTTHPFLLFCPFCSPCPPRLFGRMPRSRCRTSREGQCLRRHLRPRPEVMEIILGSNKANLKGCAALKPNFGNNTPSAGQITHQMAACFRVHVDHRPHGPPVRAVHRQLPEVVQPPLGGLRGRAEVAEAVDPHRSVGVAQEQDGVPETSGIKFMFYFILRTKWLDHSVVISDG